MVSQCANPSCSASFRYLHQGKLFRVEVGPPQGEVVSHGRWTLRRSEFFWLCENCAAEMTLEYHPQHGILLKPLAPALRAAS